MVEDKQVMISVIIPVYNIEDYITRCIESVLNQSYKNFELLLINDGSSDDSGFICDKFSNKDSRVKVFHQENKGVSAARNLGIHKAKGKWVAFVDGDDWIEENSLGKLIENSFSNSNLDILIAKSFINNGKKVGEEHYVFSPSLVGQAYNGVTVAIDKGYMRGSVWGVIYNRHFLISNEILFPVGLRNGEDSIFFRLCILYAKGVGFSNVHFYNIFERDGSASRNWSFERTFHMVNNVNYINNYISRHLVNLSSDHLNLLDRLKYSTVSNIYNSLYYSFSIKNYIVLTKSLKSELKEKLETGKINSVKNKVKILNLSTYLFGALVIMNSFIRELKKKI
ncbi:MAG TPA: glycosyltransferase family 2 protein [Epulopiscium sp.]|nr:glycosyltransferase family 2 protein [Candidatus Epulonipiscium sp.]